MTPAFCRVKNDEQAGTYGDCVRACVASILDMDTEAVPHFFHDNCDGETGNRRMVEFLRPLGYAPFWSFYGVDPREMMGAMNGDAYYMLFGATDGGDHVVVCRGYTVAHNPSWLASPLTRPGSVGHWSVMVIARS